MTEVEFPTASPFTLSDVNRLADGGRTVRGRGLLFVPEGPPRRRPAVVVMEGLGGLKPSREIDYGRRMADWGFVALVVDSFTPRRAEALSHSRRALKVTEAMMLADAFAALRFLSHHPAVDPAAISIIGFSYGGMISVLTAYEQIRRTFMGRDPRHFAAHVSFYGCSVPRLEDPTTTGAPVLIFVGEHDRNVSIPRTHLIAQDLIAGGAEVWLRTFRGVYHQWNGNDQVPRFVRHSLMRLEMTVRRDNTVRDSRTGLRIRGPVSRTLAIALGVDWRGYHILADAETTRVGDEEMVAFLGMARLEERVRRAG